MVKLKSIGCLISICLWINTLKTNCYYEFNIEGLRVDDKLAKCRLEDEENTFHCTKSSLMGTPANNSEENNTHHKLKYCSWLMSLPVLSPNTVIYNELPLELDQTDLYVNNYLEEPKFAPLYYKIKFNEYYAELEEYIRTHLDTKLDKTRGKGVNDILKDEFQLPQIILEAKSSHTTLFREDFNIKLIGNNYDPENRYRKSLLLFIDYYFFRRIKRRAYLIKFLNTFEFGYKLRFYAYCKHYSRIFRRYRRFIINKKNLIQLMELSIYFNVVSGKVEPYTPMPPVGKPAEVPLALTTTNMNFYNLIRDIWNNGHKNLNLVLDLLDQYALDLYKVEDIRSFATLDSFYVLEVMPKSTGFSLYNMYPKKERKQILDYEDRLLVGSHVEHFDFKYFIFQFIMKFVMMIPVLAIFIVMVLLYILKLVK